MRGLRWLLAAALAAGGATTASAATTGATGAQALNWAPASSAAVRPGTQVYVAGSQCTANFLYTDGRHVFLGMAAHCASTGGSNETNGCTTPTLPIGTKVTVTGARYPGVMAYSSWYAMQRLHETDPNACAGNDLALVRLDPRDVAQANPTVPSWGGPDGLNTSGLRTLEPLYSYQNSGLRGGLLPSKTGRAISEDNAGWVHTAYLFSPGIPGDSGSGMLDSSGRAVGVLSWVEAEPLAGANGFGDLAHELRYAHTRWRLPVRLVPGTVPFKG